MQYRFSKGAMDVLDSAERISESTKCTYVGTEQIVAGMLSVDCVANKVLRACGLIKEEYFELLEQTFDPNYRVNGYTPRAKNKFEIANNFANITNGGYIATEHLLLAIISDAESTATKVLDKLGVPAESVISKLEEELGIKIEFRRKDYSNPFNPEQLFDQMTQELFRGQSSPYSEQRNPVFSNANNYNQYNQRSEEGNKQQLDSKFGVDLNQKAREGKLDPVIGRDKEIERIIQILSRRTKNNPVLVGEPGVGKSAVVEGLAQKIVKGEVPELLKDKTVFSLDIGGMLAGTKYRGDFEERFKDFLDQVKNNGNVIVFIDEIHNIVGAGASTDSKMDAAEMLKPILSRGELQTIGATTIDEYRKYIEKDAALERRFQPVTVDQPSVSDTIKILKGLRDKYEAHHKVAITDSAIEAAAELSDRYISDRFLPDKAIDLIDEAASRARLDNNTTPPDFKEMQEKIDALENEKRNYTRKDDYENAAKVRDQIKIISDEIERKKVEWSNSRSKNGAQIGAEEVADIVAQWTGIPVKKLTQTESQKLINLEQDLHKRVIGQDEAVSAVAKAIRRARAGLKEPKRPIGSFIFVGPTGVGKTELAKALAECVFGDEKLLIRVDMSEYMEKQSVAKLIGAPPGYVGYDDTNGQLTEKVRRKPYSVLLFDEIEKAHPDVFNVLLQILDDGRLTDSKGRIIDFKNTIIIMTSNAGATEISKITRLGFNVNSKNASTEDYDRMKEQVMDALKSSFRPEFLNRLDEIIVFHHLTKAETREVAELLVNNLAKRLAEKGITITVSSAAVDHLLIDGYDEEYGARPLRRAIQRQIEDRLSEEILKGTINLSDSVKIDCDNNGLTFTRI